MRLVAVAAVGVILASMAFSVEIYVSPQGLDSNSGNKSEPVKSLEKARDLGRVARGANPDQAVTIMLYPGVYEISKSVEFTKLDSGTALAPLVIKGILDSNNSTERPLLVGGVVVDGWKRSDFNGRSDVFEADLKPLDLKAKFRQIYLNGTRQIWARYPNHNPELPYSGGWAYVQGERPPMYTDIEGERTDVVTLRAKDMRKWSRPGDGEICIFPRYNWWNKIVPIKSFDQETRTITLTENMPYAARPEDRYAVFGMQEELDVQGEWYQDVEAQKLYFLPPVELREQKVTVPTVSSILKFEGVENAVVRGLELTCSSQNAIYLNNCKNVSIEKSLIHDLGYMHGGGITINKGYDCIIRGCDIWNIGGHGVEIYAGEAVEMDMCNHVVDNCYIHHVGQFNRHGIGIMVGGTGVTIAHNLIHDMPRCGVFHGGVLHTLEYNRIRHCNLEMEDTGCTYGGGWTGGWTTIRYNHCTDSIGFNNHGKFFVFAWGIYLDESGCGYDVYGNIVERCQVGAMHLHNARENHIYNNIFAHNGGRDGQTHQFSLQGWNDNPAGLFLKERQPKMVKIHNELLKNPRWAKMRGMHVSPEAPFLQDGNIMRGNIIEKNIFYYPNQPESSYISAYNLNLQYNIIDYNIIWSGGSAPIKTGKHGYRRSVRNLSETIPNADFSAIASLPAVIRDKLLKDPNQTEVKGWYWYHKTSLDAKAETASVNSKPSLKIYASYNPDNEHIKYACVKSDPFNLEPGRDYSLSFKLRMKDQNGGLTARFVAEGSGYWKGFGAKAFQSKDDGFIECETVFKFPASDEADFIEGQSRVTLQFQFDSKTGTAEISDLTLTQVEMASEWESWQQLGADVHSIIADPLFVDADNGDFNLKPDSPALRQGFKPLPLNKIGLYESDARATWPVVEAQGVRENPQWLQDVSPKEK